MTSRFLPGIWSWRIGRRLFSFAQSSANPSEVLIRTVTGSQIVVRSDDMVGHTALLCGCYDWFLVAMVKTIVPRSGCVVEVGANIGTETVCFSDIVGPNGRIYALEPSPGIFEFLLRNLSLAKATNVVPIQVAAGAVEGEVPFVIASTWNTGMGRVISGEQNESQTLVSCKTLDSILPIHQPIALIAIDVEGFEYAVLEGANAIIDRCRPVVSFEMLDTVAYEDGIGFQSFVEWFEVRNYSIYVPIRGQLRPLDKERPHLTGNIGEQNWYAMPNERQSEIDGINKCLRRIARMPHVFRLNPLST